MSRRVAIIGGGAAGFFASIQAAEHAREHGKPIEVFLLESSGSVLKKVRISGGGRCNVTHNCFDVATFCQNYPRGGRELRSPMQNFQARDTVAWFKSHGVELVAEDDGRMFPTTNSSQTIIDCYLSNANRSGVKLRQDWPVKTISLTDKGSFSLGSTGDRELDADAVLIATGSSKAGHRLAAGLGHTITDLAPSLFSFKITDPLLQDLQGSSFANVQLQLRVPDGRSFEETGPLLITHWGLSGPAVLKLSAWAARDLKRCGYRASLRINWTGDKNSDWIASFLRTTKERNPRLSIATTPIPGVSKRFWIRFLETLHLDKAKNWSEISHKELLLMATRITSTELAIHGQNRFKEEFVECGGVSLKEIDFKTMQSKLIPGLYFAGEILDIDGITGGFNFQNAWTTAWIAGRHMVDRCPD